MINYLPYFLKKYVYHLAYLGYFPNTISPKTFNEKIHYRKKYWADPRYINQSDKIAVKDYVAEKIDGEIVIPNLFVGGSLSVPELKKINKINSGCVVKANHNSGPVFVLSGEESDERLGEVCDSINNQLTIDFGKVNGETWYSKIKPCILIEKKLETHGEPLLDYKFHVFRSDNGEQECVLHIDYDRETNHSRSLFTEDLTWLPFGIKYPVIHTSTLPPVNYEAMLDIAKSLASDHAYVRVDLYNINGRIYFGEMTFAHGAGWEGFTSKAHDKWLGSLWSMLKERAFSK